MADKSDINNTKYTNVSQEFSYNKFHSVNENFDCSKRNKIAVEKPEDPYSLLYFTLNEGSDQDLILSHKIFKWRKYHLFIQNLDLYKSLYKKNPKPVIKIIKNNIDNMIDKLNKGKELSLEEFQISEDQKTIRISFNTYIDKSDDKDLDISIDLEFKLIYDDEKLKDHINSLEEQINSVHLRFIELKKEEKNKNKEILKKQDEYKELYNSTFNKSKYQ